MSMTYASLSLEVAGRLEIGSTDVDKFKVQDSLNEAQRHILSTFDIRFLTEAVKTVRGNLVNATVMYQYPADFMRYIQLWLNYSAEIPNGDPANIGKPARLMIDDEIVQTNRNMLANVTYPSVSLGVEGGFEIRPAPTAAQSNGFRLRYVYQLPEIAAAQDCLFRTAKRNLVVFYATMLSAAVENYRPDLVSTYKALYDEEAGPMLPKSETKEGAGRK